MCIILLLYTYHVSKHTLLRNVLSEFIYYEMSFFDATYRKINERSNTLGVLV